MASQGTGKEMKKLILIFLLFTSCVLAGTNRWMLLSVPNGTTGTLYPPYRPIVAESNLYERTIGGTQYVGVVTSDLNVQPPMFIGTNALLQPYALYDAQSNATLQIWDGRQSVSANYAYYYGSIILANTVKSNNFTVGGINFINAALPTYSNRVAIILGMTDSSTNSGTIRFYTMYNSTIGERVRVKSEGALCIYGGSAFPSAATAGDIFYLTTTNKHYGYNGTGWSALY
jgi:hypothetical protein